MQLLNQLSIKTKLIVMLLVVSVCAMLASTYICSSSGKSILTEKMRSLLMVRDYSLISETYNVRSRSCCLAQ